MNKNPYKSFKNFVKRKIWLFISMLIIITAGFVLSQINAHAAITNPSISLGVSVISEGDDFATRVLGLPWDMNNPPYPGFSRVFENIDRDTFFVQDGFWNMQTEDPNGANLMMHWAGIESTQIVLKTGIAYPIDTNQYQLLSFYLCSNANTSANLYWFYDQTPYDIVYGISRYITVVPGCKLYVINLDEIDKFQGDWEGKPIGFRIDPVNHPAQFQIGWIRLTSIDPQNIVPIHWENLNYTSNLNFYISKNGCGIDGIPIGSIQAGERGTFNWGETLLPNSPFGTATPYPLPESIEPGLYYIYALINDIGNPICATSQLEIHKAPILSFQKPSYFSGPDYATEVVGDPWGMANAEDIIATKEVAGLTFKDGIASFRTTEWGNNLTLNVTEPINSDKYKYITARYYIEDERTEAGGWVQKFVWWYQGPACDPVVTRPTVTEEGWHTYSYDLSKALIEREGESWSGSPTGFRFDPNESHDPRNVHLDFITIPGDEIVSQGKAFEIYYEISKTDPGTIIHFYYDNDTNPDNGRNLIGSTKYQISYLWKNNNFFIFLPLSINSMSSPPAEKEIDLLTGERYIWYIGNVPPGSYYISADIVDDVMTTTWYSELPVIVE